MGCTMLQHIVRFIAFAVCLWHSWCCKIHVLDADQLVRNEDVQVPICNMYSRDVWPFAHMDGMFVGEHKLLPENNQYSSSYHISKAIKSSSMYTDDINSADIVLVDQSCYYVWYIAALHYKSSSMASVPVTTSYMAAIFNRIVNLPSWKKSNGSHFAFIFTFPGSFDIYGKSWCLQFMHPFLLLAETATRCATHRLALIKSRTIILPLVSNFKHKDIHERSIFVFYQGGCKSDPKYSPGMQLRAHTARVLGSTNETDIHVACSSLSNGKHYSEFIDLFYKSVFCLVLAGDMQSSRRQAEVMMCGCIPVFIGPPYNAMPLRFTVPYKEIGIILQIERTPWVNSDQSEATISLWSQYTVIKPTAILPELSYVIPYLRSIAKDRIERMRTKLLNVSQAFNYTFDKAKFEKRRNVGGLVANRLCHLKNLYPDVTSSITAI